MPDLTPLAMDPGRRCRRLDGHQQRRAGRARPAARHDLRVPVRRAGVDRDRPADAPRRRHLRRHGAPSARALGLRAADAAAGLHRHRHRRVADAQRERSMFRPVTGWIILGLAVLQLARLQRPHWFGGVPHNRWFAWGMGLLAGVTTMLANAAGTDLRARTRSRWRCRSSRSSARARGSSSSSTRSRCRSASRLGLIHGQTLLLNLVLVSGHRRGRVRRTLDHRPTSRSASSTCSCWRLRHRGAAVDWSVLNGSWKMSNGRLARARCSAGNADGGDGDAGLHHGGTELLEWRRAEGERRGQLEQLLVERIGSRATEAHCLELNTR